jgi:hypothetical protein
MDNHDSRNAHSPEASTDERASLLNLQPGPDADLQSSPAFAGEGDHPEGGGEAAAGGTFVEAETPEDATPEDAPPPPRPADSRFSSEAEERAYWAGVRIGMENAAAARAAQTDAGSHRPDRRPAAAQPATCPEPPPLLSENLNDLLAERIHDTVDASYPAGARKPRHDGFTPEKMGEFLRHLAATGVVEHAAAAVRVSASAAYALRNRRGGRAFARMWDAILINRSRDRLVSELSSRAIAGCVSIRKKDGEIVSEHHHYDNRLAMSMLTRFDRLAEKEAPFDAHLRALSEDLEEFIDCLAMGEDADAFVERRRPAPEPEPAAQPAPAGRPAAVESALDAPAIPDPMPDVAAMARMARTPDYLGVPPHEVPVDDLDLTDRQSWGPDEHVRFYRSGFAFWLAFAEEEGDVPLGRAATLQFDTCRLAARAFANVYGSEDVDRDAPVETEDLLIDEVENWSEEQRARAWRCGFLQSLPNEVWEKLAGLTDEDEDQDGLGGYDPDEEE